MNRSLILRSLTMLAVLVPLSAAAALIEGVVQGEDDGVLAGALVTLTSGDRLYAETVYTDAGGAFSLNTAQTGTLELRARKPYYTDGFEHIEVNSGSRLQPRLVLRRMSAPEEIADSLPASAHFKRIQFRDAREQGFFQVDCLTCHQIGNAFTRMARPELRWQQIATRMLSFWGVKDESQIARHAELLSRAFTGQAEVVQENDHVDPLIFRARIREWKLPLGVIAHDVEYHAADGRFYTVDQGADRIYITDPDSNRTEVYEIPGGDIPIGGKFTRVFGGTHPLATVLPVRRGPHSLQEGPDGRFYTTDTISSQIGVFDPATRSYEGYDIGGKALYPHTLRFDAHGRVWFTIAVSNQLGRFDPKTKEMTVIDLPETTDRPWMPAYNPYGIDISPIDGSVWYTRLTADRIGRVDPKTLEVTEFEPPLIGPRRMRFARDGTLWIPAYGDGTLVRLDTATMKYTTYRIPPLSPGELEAPYAVAVHPSTQEVWITANMSDRMFRFLPREERFIAYPLPTRGIFTRDLIFVPDGGVCSSSSPTPAIPTVVEGGMQEVICLYPDG